MNGIRVRRPNASGPAVLFEASAYPLFRREVAFDPSMSPVPADVVISSPGAWERATAVGRQPLDPLKRFAG
jgi:hypothetical protein